MGVLAEIYGTFTNKGHLKIINWVALWRIQDIDIRRAATQFRILAIESSKDRKK